MPGLAASASSGSSALDDSVAIVCLKVMNLMRIIVSAIAVIAASHAVAQVVTYEQAGAILAASCGADIDNTCRGVNLEPARMKECLRRNFDVLSPKCAAEYPRAIGAIEQRVTARFSLSKLCNWEMKHLCGEVRNDPSKGLTCLLEATKRVTPNCSKAIAAAGYR
jgi:hypothetical protein